MNETLEKINIEIDVLEKEEINIIETNEKQVIVHCKQFLNIGDGIRIWKSTFLIEKETGLKRKLIHAENITMHPEWKVAEKSGNYHFTLFFEGLSKGCKSFDIVEVIPQPGGFAFKNISRNKSDVYQVTFTF